MFKQFEALQESVHAIFGTEMPDEIPIAPDRHKKILAELGMKWQHEDPDGVFFYIGQSKVRPVESRVTFELFTDARNKWRFHLLSSNAKIIMSSEPYHTKANARRAAKRAREVMASCDLVNEEETKSPAKPRIGLFKDTSKKWRMHIIGGNSQVLLSSEAYSSKTRAVQTAVKLPGFALQASITVKEEE